MSNKRLSYIFAGLTIMFWGTAASAFKFTLNHFSYIQLLAWSSLFSTLLLLLIIIVLGKFKEIKSVPRKAFIQSIYLGLLNPFAYYFILFRAYELLPAQVAQPLNFIWPLVLVILSVPLLGEKLSLKGLLALIVSFIGVIIISSEGNLSSFQIKSPLGVVLALTSSVIWALYWILNLRKSLVDPIVRLFFNFLFATMFSFIAGTFFDQFWNINPMGIYGSIYVGSFEMGITFVLWLKALSLAESKAKLNNIIYLVPFVSLVFIHFFVGESIYWTTVVGLLIIVGSILYQQLHGNRIKN
ncbi:MAG: DMT family transporter [Tenuifilaceae bacterium]|jgi:drug/metabolite transporter (DMT)-like permease|nr:DMT family transporter [Tenuifilaceae bacterium]